MDEKNQQQQKPSQLSEVVKTLKDANNILIIISRDPNIDQLSASIGLTIALNKADKHATAVFSGNVPPILEFLEPEKTLEKNTDSLRDFIISLDKSKADKLRYKVEDNVVRIFITPYKTSISDKDLDFSQGDFNVNAVVALGVQNKSDLDEAIVAHGRILHDATIISVSNQEASELGSIQWVRQGASSLSEMVTDLVSAYDKKLMDSQTATALLTGIVYETDRFRNEKSSPHTMSVSGVLMEAGASTQLVATKLEENHSSEDVDVDEIPNVIDEPEEYIEEQEPKKKDPGLIEIDHDDDIHIDETGNLHLASDIDSSQNSVIPEDVTDVIEDSQSGQTNSGGSMVYEPPTFGGQLTANTSKVDQQYASNPDPLTSSDQQGSGPTLSHGLDDHQTLSDLEKSVNSPHVFTENAPSSASSRARVIEPLSPGPGLVEPENTGLDQKQQIEYASSAVERAVASADYKPEPLQALNAQPLGMDLNPQPVITPVQPVGINAEPGQSITPPPPVPPPMMPQ